MNLITLLITIDYDTFAVDAAPFISSLIAHLIAQGVKPLTEWPKIRRFHVQAIFMSGGFPSSHTATIFSLATMVGLIEGFNSTLFMMSLVFASLFAYDAMNVRLYAGRNIKLTKKLIEDLQKSETIHINLEDPIYSIKMKDVLGHKLIEVIAGAIFGVLVALSYYYLIVK